MRGISVVSLAMACVALTGAMASAQTHSRLAVDSNGFTVFPALSGGAKNFYVATGGNDTTNNGESTSAPKKTIAAGYALLRDGYGDRLNIHSGQTFNESLSDWSKSGASPTNPMVIKVYGNTGRPILGGAGDGWNTSAAVHDVVMQGIEWRPSETPDYSDEWNGIRTLHDSENLLFEDCIIRNYPTNVVMQGADYPGGPHRVNDVRFRRCIIRDAWDYNPSPGSSHSQGAYCNNVDGLLFEDCVVHHNGWPVGSEPLSVFAHNLYMNNGNTDVKVINCFLSYASSDGVQMRCGGQVGGCIAMYNALGIQFGAGGDDGYLVDTGVPLDLSDSLILAGTDIGTQERGWGVRIANISEGTVENVIIAGPNYGGFQIPFQIIGDACYGAYHWAGGCHPAPIPDPDHVGPSGLAGVGTENVAIENLRVSDWGGNMFATDPDNIIGVTMTDCHIPEFEYHDEPVGDPPIDVSGLGPADTTSLDIEYYDDLLDTVLARPRNVWSLSYKTVKGIIEAKVELGYDH